MADRSWQSMWPMSKYSLLQQHLLWCMGICYCKILHCCTVLTKKPNCGNPSAARWQEASKLRVGACAINKMNHSWWPRSLGQWGCFLVMHFFFFCNASRISEKMCWLRVKVYITWEIKRMQNIVFPCYQFSVSLKPCSLCLLLFIVKTAMRPQDIVPTSSCYGCLATPSFETREQYFRHFFLLEHWKAYHWEYVDPWRLLRKTHEPDFKTESSHLQILSVTCSCTQAIMITDTDGKSSCKNQTGDKCTFNSSCF